jgi:hypothetical protein
MLRCTCTHTHTHMHTHTHTSGPRITDVVWQVPDMGVYPHICGYMSLNVQYRTPVVIVNTPKDIGSTPNDFGRTPIVDVDLTIPLWSVYTSQWGVHT